MQIRIRETGQLMYEDEFRRNNIHIPLPTQLTEEWLNEFQADVVFQGPSAPVNSPYEFSYYSGVELIEGKWYTVYSTGPVFTDNEEGTAAQQMAAYRARIDTDRAIAIRRDRDALLAKTDWTQGKDIADDVSTSWAPYRQALRDVPTQTGFPWNVEWPVKE